MVGRRIWCGFVFPEMQDTLRFRMTLIGLLSMQTPFHLHRDFVGPYAL